MQSETGFPSSHQLKSYVAYKSRLKLAARAVLSADAGLFVICLYNHSAALLVFVLVNNSLIIFVSFFYTKTPLAGMLHD